MAKIKVVVVDDSALVRSLLTEIINRQHDMVCIGAASDPLVAREMIRELNPDVITLDVEMPRMDGLEFLSRLMRLRPMPVVMVSTLTEQGAEITLRALEMGAIDFVAKPRIGVSSGLNELAGDIVDKIRVAASAHVKRLPPAPGAGSAPAGGGAAEPPRAALPRVSTEKIICIGASTGGTEAIKDVLLGLPADSPGIVITQHMPPGFTRSFAERLNRMTRLNVVEAKGGERILPGHAFLAPGDKHLLVERSGANYVTRLSDAEPVRRHKPAVDPMFRSVAQCAGRNVIACLLTGMGKDGAQGMLEIRQAGGYTVAQNEATCVVYGMPREAVAIGGAEDILPLGEIAEALLQQARKRGGGNRV